MGNELMSDATTRSPFSRTRLPARPAVIVLIAIIVLAQVSTGFAQHISATGGGDASRVPIRPDASRGVGQFRDVRFRDAARQPQSPAAPRRENWSQRHPVLLGALIGAGTGLIVEHSNCGLSSCRGVVAGAFTGAGAWGGLIASAVHKRRMGQPVGWKIKAGLVGGAVGAALGAFLFCYGAGGCGGVS
jgi:hypothetical protein